ncbi:MAG: alpha-(1-_3)-arabinofuranosyltransferase family protein, partial [Actinomycetota bacterium]
MLAYVPALCSSPGRMPADTKLGLYLDPVGLTAGARSTFDATQYAGWVPHQHVAYLWPSGPWFAAFELAGAPDWIAHRLWVGTILLLAGTGIGWFLRKLGFAPAAALAGALVYQLSPYVLAYVSRTSALLLPFAGLGWIAGAALLGCRDHSRFPWRWPAVIALVVATIGAVNATALLMIVPAAVLVLVHARRTERQPWSQVGMVAGLTTIACVAVSLWWVSMSFVQRTHGADVLAYSESLRSVSSSSTAFESLRGLGYWLFYVRDHVGATTSASLDHLESIPVIALGSTLLVLSLIGLAVAGDGRARLGAWSVAIGVVVAVGVHPIDDRSPVISVLGGDLDSGVALALRSTARAVPVVLLGLAIGAASLVRVAPWPRLLGDRIRGATHALTAMVIGLLALSSTPAWWTVSLVDPDLDRDQDVPTAWQLGADHLEATSATGRVLQLPGAEFGAFAWGATVDQPLPHLVERPVLTRDLLPLGSPAAMDLLFALDDRLQDGTFEAESLGPVARWLGVDRVWVAGDLDVERYDTARPAVLLDQLRSSDLGTIVEFGDPAGSGRSVIDEELLGLATAADETPPVAIVDLDDPGRLVRVRTDEVVLAGSGDGLVDAAAGRVLDGSELIVSAIAATDDRGDEGDGGRTVERLVVTDSFRDRAHHWRTSQDVHGFTERDGPASGLLTDDDADERLPVFDGAARRTPTDADRTV